MRLNSQKTQAHVKAADEAFIVRLITAHAKAKRERDLRKVDTCVLSLQYISPNADLSQEIVIILLLKNKTEWCYRITAQTNLSVFGSDD